MENYNIKIQMIKEDVISISAYSKKEAIKKAEELVSNTNLKDLNIKNITNHYILIDVAKRYFFKRNKKIIKMDDLN